ALRVVAGGRGDHAALALLLLEGEQAVERAARLERARVLVVLELERDAGAHRLRQRVRRAQGRHLDGVAAATTGFLDVGEGHHGRALSPLPTRGLALMRAPVLAAAA